MSPAGISSSLSTLIQANGTDPGTNTEASTTVPAGKSWLLLSYSIVNVQGGAGASLPILVIDDGTDTIFASPGSTANQAISTTARYTWAPGLVISGQIGTTPNIFSFGSLPEGILLGTGYRVRTVTVGLSANTDYGAPSLHYVEYG